MTTKTLDPATKSSFRALEWRQFITRFHLAIVPFLAIVAPLGLILAVPLRLHGLSHVFDIWPSCLVLFLCAVYSRLRPLPRMIETTELALLSLLVLAVLTELTLLTARSRYGLVDAQLSAADAAFHFSTGYFVRSVAKFPLLARFLQICYQLAIPMISLSVIIPPILGHANASRRSILAIVLAAIVTVSIFWFLPAAGPWTVQGFQPTIEQSAVTNYLSLLKTHAPFTTDCKTTAIISFPSFHVVLAIVAAAAIGSIRVLRIAAWTLAALICISTITTGWHYGVDVVGGLIIAWASIAVAGWIVQEPASATSRPGNSLP
ncbi:MAG TPA: phosphatase PAP2 family protein [Terracidiphilus sp.]|nr:phosphatase PAP2 family protein [Terracidiphilus sp.]